MCCAGKTLLNLDTEDWGEIFIGCAGGGDSMITLPVQQEALDASSADAYTITVSGSLPHRAGLSVPSANVSLGPLAEPTARVVFRADTFLGAGHLAHCLAVGLCCS